MIPPGKDRVASEAASAGREPVPYDEPNPEGKVGDLEASLELPTIMKVPDEAMSEVPYLLSVARSTVAAVASSVVEEFTRARVMIPVGHTPNLRTGLRYAKCGETRKRRRTTEQPGSTSYQTPLLPDEAEGILCTAAQNRKTSKCASHRLGSQSCT
ncbi:hypothetical protein MMC06_006578 [Schaereria dolodes]|nr:hypothetical protein [Schaereria dolodes]